jgi:hypothetical protein
MLLHLEPIRHCHRRICRSVFSPEDRLLAAIFDEPLAFSPGRRRLLKRIRNVVDRMVEDE